MTRHRRTRITLAAGLLFAAFLLGGTQAQAYDGVTPCGGLAWPVNEHCRVVDVLDRGLFGETLYSDVRVVQAWNQLRDEGCYDVSNVVVAGTLSEDGAPLNPIPGTFAYHLVDPDRCAMVVRYLVDGSFGIPDPFNLLDYDRSVEHGRKALAVTLNAVDALRRASGRTGKIRVWGHSKGAAIVESTWRMEARNRNTKYITTLWDWGSWRNRDHYVDACPSNNCYYFGFGYPRAFEQASAYSISRATASTWTNSTDGKIAKPPTHHRDWHRLTTFTQLYDGIYECDNPIDCAIEAQGDCHKYGALIDSRSFAAWDEWNRAGSLRSEVVPSNTCGDPD